MLIHYDGVLDDDEIDQYRALPGSACRYRPPPRERSPASTSRTAPSSDHVAPASAVPSPPRPPPRRPACDRSARVRLDCSCSSLSIVVRCPRVRRGDCAGFIAPALKLSEREPQVLCATTLTIDARGECNHAHAQSDPISTRNRDDCSEWLWWYQQRRRLWRHHGSTDGVCCTDSIGHRADQVHQSIEPCR